MHIVRLGDGKEGKENRFSGGCNNKRIPPQQAVSTFAKGIPPPLRGPPPFNKGGNSLISYTNYNILWSRRDSPLPKGERKRSFQGDGKVNPPIQTNP